MLTFLSVYLYFFYLLPLISSEGTKDKSLESIETSNLRTSHLKSEETSLLSVSYTTHAYLEQIVDGPGYLDFVSNEAGTVGCLIDSIFNSLEAVLSVKDHIVDFTIYGEIPENLDSNVSTPSTASNLSISYYLLAPNVYSYNTLNAVIAASLAKANTYMNEYAVEYGANTLTTATLLPPYKILNLGPISPSSVPINYPSLQPTTKPTFNPTLSPSYVPSLYPTPTPTFLPTPSPSSNPTPTAAPNSNDLSYTDVYQYINGAGYADYLSNPYAYTVTFTSTIQSCLFEILKIPTYTINVIALQINSPSASYRPSTTTYLSLAYTVSVRGGYSVLQVGQSLLNCTINGEWDIYMHTYALTDSASALATATTEMPSYQISVPFGLNKSSSGGLTPEYIALTVVLVVLGVPFIAYGIYHGVIRKPDPKPKKGRLEAPVEPGQDELNSLFYNEYATSRRDGLGDIPLVNPMGDSIGLMNETDLGPNVVNNSISINDSRERRNSSVSEARGRRMSMQSETGSTISQSRSRGMTMMSEEGWNREIPSHGYLPRDRDINDTDSSYSRNYYDTSDRDHMNNNDSTHSYRTESTVQVEEDHGSMSLIAAHQSAGEEPKIAYKPFSAR